MSQGVWIREEQWYCSLTQVNMTPTNVWVHWLQEVQEQLQSSAEDKQIKHVHPSWAPLCALSAPIDKVLTQMLKIKESKNAGSATSIMEIDDGKSVGKISQCILSATSPQQYDYDQNSEFDRIVLGSWVQAQLYGSNMQKIIRGLEADQVNASSSQSRAQDGLLVLIALMHANALEKKETMEHPSAKQSYNMQDFLYKNLVSLWRVQYTAEQLDQIEQQWRAQLKVFLIQCIGVKVQKVGSHTSEAEQTVVYKIEGRGAMPVDKKACYELLIKTKSTTQGQQNMIKKPWEEGAKNARHIYEAIGTGSWVGLYKKQLKEVQKQCQRMLRLPLEQSASAEAQVTLHAVQLIAQEYLKQGLCEELALCIGVPVEQLEIKSLLDDYVPCQTYALALINGGYASANGVQGGSLSSAKLFDTPERALASAKNKDGVAAVVQLSMEPKRVVHRLDHGSAQVVQEGFAQLEHTQLEQSFEALPWDLLEEHLTRSGVTKELLQQVQAQIQEQKQKQKQKMPSKPVRRI